MNEIICPKCDKAFKVDEAGFAAIQKHEGKVWRGWGGMTQNNDQ